MTHAIERTSETAISIAVRAPYKELEPLLETAAKRISENADFEGFRRGKAPYEIVRSKVGEFKILEEAARSYIERKFQDVLKEVEEKEYGGKNFEPVGEPQVTITKLAPGEDLEFKIALAILPPVELADYRVSATNILKTKRPAEVTDKEVSEAVEWLRETRAKLVTVSRGARHGDRVEIDVAASLDGAPLENAASKNHPLIIGSGRFPAELESSLGGMKAGEKGTFVIAVPPDWRDKTLAGKAVEFSVKMNLVQERLVPAWNDEFASSIGSMATASAAEDNIREGLRMEKEEKERERLRMAVIQDIADRTKAEIPDALIERELEKMLSELKSSITDMGLKFEEYLTHIKKTEADLASEWRDDAKRRVKIALTLRAIADRERIQPSEDDLKAAMAKTAAHRGVKAEDVAAVDREAFIRYHVGVARNEKVFKFLESLTQ